MKRDITNSNFSSLDQYYHNVAYKTRENTLICLMQSSKIMIIIMLCTTHV